MKCSVCCQVLQQGKEEILFRGPLGVTQFGARCGIPEGKTVWKSATLELHKNTFTKKSDRIDKCLCTQVMTSSLGCLQHLIHHSSFLLLWRALSEPCLLNGDFMPKVWSAQLTVELTEKPAVCLSAPSEAGQTLKDTHFIDISGTWYLCGDGTCVGRGGRSGSGTTGDWAPDDWSVFPSWVTEFDW